MGRGLRAVLALGLLLLRLGEWPQAPRAPVGTRDGCRRPRGGPRDSSGRSLPEWGSGRGTGTGTGEGAFSLLSASSEARSEVWQPPRGLWEGVAPPRVTLARALPLSGRGFLVCPLMGLRLAAA